MRATFLKGVALGSVVSLLTLAATAAFAGTGVGKVLDLGESNRVNVRTQLEGTAPSALLNVSNANKSGAASGVSIDVPAGNPPLVVNSATKVKNLNADLLDGQGASAFQGATSKSCPSGSAISSIAPNGVAACDSPIVLPLEVHVAPQGESTLAPSTPSTMQLAFSCVDPIADIEVFNAAAGTAPATINYSYGANGSTPNVGTFTSFTGAPFDISTTAQAVGEFTYLDRATVTTVNFSALDQGADGCEFEGTVVMTLR